jgi:3-hydroxyisobutyrate dehydrogenase-like beta-hydroxyacid dehydrogenase
MFNMNVSVLGLGIIGSAWAKNLIADGHTVRCWNAAEENGHRHRLMDAKRFCKVAVDAGIFFLGCDGEGKRLRFV